jgi:hypothetical protein
MDREENIRQHITLFERVLKHSDKNSRYIRGLVREIARLRESIKQTGSDE